MNNSGPANRPDNPAERASKAKRLNVVIHGLWAIETNGDHIRLTTPDMGTDHAIKAGKVRHPEIDLAKSGKKSFKLDGVMKGQPGDLPKDLTFQVVFKGKAHKADLNKMALEILLPYPSKPNDIHSVRLYDTDNKPFFEGDFPPTPPSKAAVVTVFGYEFNDIGNLSFHPAEWDPQFNADGRTVNLHLYAQPETDIEHGEHHREKGYEKLAAAFGLKMKPIREVELPEPLDPDIDGLNLVDTMALFEFGAAVSPPNCDPCVFDNTP